MRRLLSILFMLLAVRGYGAAGDIKSAAVETNGWVLDVTVDTISTNGSWNFGLPTNNAGQSKVLLTVTSLGFDDLGNTTTVSRVLYGTKQVRLPYPNNAGMDITNIGSDALMKVSLSDFVFQNCSNLTLSIAANWYSNNNAAANLSVTNNSVVQHPKCIANWSYPGWQKITGNTMTLRAVAFHRSGQQGRPVRVMRFVARDENGHFATNWVTNPTIDRSMADAIPVVEYVAQVDVSGMNASNRIRCDFTAYPWVGDTNAVTDTMDGVYGQPTPFYAPITNLCDRTGVYLGATAVVDPVNGSDSNGRASTNSDPTTISSGLYFQTIGKAAVLCIASNNTYFGHNDAGGANIYLVAYTNYQFTGSANTYAGTARSWCTIKPYPGVSQSQVILANQGSDRAFGNNPIHVQGLTITNNSAIMFLSIPYLWVDGCFLNYSASATFDGTTQQYWTFNTFSNLSGGISYIAGQLWYNTLIRGNYGTNLTFGSANQAFVPYTFIGNNLTLGASPPATILHTDPSAGMPTKASVGTIVAFNRVMGITANAQAVLTGVNSNNVFGSAWVQNVIERSAASSGSGLVQINGNGTGVYVSPFNNQIIWYETHEGERDNIAYDATGTSASLSYLWSFKKNILSPSYNIKTDDYTGFGGASGNRTGDWPVLYGVGMADNILGIINTTQFSSAGAFMNEFPGLFTMPTNQVTTVSYWPTNYYGYIAEVGYGYNGATAGIGNGNYRLQSSSPLLATGDGWYGLPFDLEGNARGGFDPPGAYASASPRKGGMFFAQ